MKTRQLLELEPAALTAYVQQLPAKDCERHLRKLLKKLHGPEIETYLDSLEHLSTASNDAAVPLAEQYLPDMFSLFPEQKRDPRLVGTVLVIGLKCLGKRLEKTRDGYKAILRRQQRET